MKKLTLKSAVFKHGETIPRKYTCDGDNINPLLEIQNLPEGTVSSALIVDDPDATRGVPWDHWLIWNIPAKTQYISEDNVPAGATLGKTSFGSTGYGGPCPPRGSGPHRYMFKLFALDCTLDVPEGIGKAELLEAMRGHVLGETTLIGLYARS